MGVPSSGAGKPSVTTVAGIGTTWQTWREQAGESPTPKRVPGNPPVPAWGQRVRDPAVGRTAGRSICLGAAMRRSRAEGPVGPFIVLAAPCGIENRFDAVWLCDDRYHAIRCAEALGCADGHASNSADTSVVQT